MRYSGLGPWIAVSVHRAQPSLARRCILGAVSNFDTSVGNACKLGHVPASTSPLTQPTDKHPPLKPSEGKGRLARSGNLLVCQQCKNPGTVYWIRAILPTLLDPFSAGPASQRDHHDGNIPKFLVWTSIRPHQNVATLRDTQNHSLVIVLSALPPFRTRDAVLPDMLCFVPANISVKNTPPTINNRFPSSQQQNRDPEDTKAANNNKKQRAATRYRRRTAPGVVCVHDLAPAAPSVDPSWFPSASVAKFPKQKKCCRPF